MKRYVQKDVIALLEKGVRDHNIMAERLNLTPKQVRDCMSRIKKVGYIVGMGFPRKPNVEPKVRSKAVRSELSGEYQFVTMSRDLKELGTRDIDWPWYGDHECKFKKV
jgi:hypothetical protein